METVTHLMRRTVHLRVPLGQTTYRRNYHPNIYVRHIPNNVAVLTLNPWQLSHLWVVLRSWSNFIWVGSGFEGVKMIHIDMDLFALRTGYFFLVVLWSNICFRRPYKRNGSEFRGHRYAQRSYEDFVSFVLGWSSTNTSTLTSFLVIFAVDWKSQNYYPAWRCIISLKNCHWTVQDAVSRKAIRSTRSLQE